MDLNGYDLDGVLTAGVEPVAPWVCISGRTHLEAGEVPAVLSQAQSTHFRGVGIPGDRDDAARFKARKITELGVTRFYEDDPDQAAIIRKLCDDVEVVQVP